MQVLETLKVVRGGDIVVFITDRSASVHSVTLHNEQMLVGFNSCSMSLNLGTVKNLRNRTPDIFDIKGPGMFDLWRDLETNQKTARTQIHS